MNKRLVFIVYSVFVCAFCCSCSAQPHGNYSHATVFAGQPQTVHEVNGSLAGHQLSVMLARTDVEKMLGLMFFEHLEDDKAMLFVYNSPRPMSFWMKNTKIPLDLIFFSENLEITEWIENMQPGFGKPDHQLEYYQSVMPAQYALEMAAGSVKRLNLKPGDRLVVPVTLLYSE